MALTSSEEIEEETFARMQALQDESEQPFHELSDLLEAELEYHSKCREILEELRDTWPSGYASKYRHRSGSRRQWCQADKVEAAYHSLPPVRVPTPPLPPAPSARGPHALPAPGEPRSTRTMMTLPIRAGGIGQARPRPSARAGTTSLLALRLDRQRRRRKGSWVALARLARRAG